MSGWDSEERAEMERLVEEKWPQDPIARQGPIARALRKHPADLKRQLEFVRRSVARPLTHRRRV